MRLSRLLSVALFPLSLLTALGCSSTQNPIPEQEAPGITHNADPPPVVAPGDRDPAHIAALWLPNRILDICDLVRAGVDVGPGIGFDFSFTHYMRLAAMTRTSGGLGYQTFRHPPVKFSHEEYYVAGIQSGEAGLGEGWYQQTFDLRIEAHALLVGAHAAFNFAELFDFFAGLATFDPMHDDY